MSIKLEVGKFYRTRDGRKVGPMVRENFEDGEPWTAEDASEFWGDSGKWDTRSHAPSHRDLIAEWTDTPTGPVRTVTRKEIVPGIYGRLQVNAETGGEVIINLTDRQSVKLDRGNFSAAECRDIAASLTEIADALEAP